MEYPRLTNPGGGLTGALCSRAEGHVLRLSLLYALLDSAAEIRIEHIRAALAFWSYCARSIEHLFNDQSGDHNRDKLVKAAAIGPLTISDASRVFGCNREIEWVKAKLTQLVRDDVFERTVIEGKRKEQVPAWKLKAA